jgi:hypothetical protein
MKESLPRQLLVLGLKYVCARNRAGGCNSTQLSGAIAPTLLCESEPEAAPAALPKNRIAENAATVLGETMPVGQPFLRALQNYATCRG